MGTPNRGGFGGAVGRAGTTRKRPGASIADTRAVRGGLGYGGSDGSGTPAGHFAVVDGTLAASTVLVAGRAPLWALCPSKHMRRPQPRFMFYGRQARMAAGMVRHTGFDRHLWFGLGLARPRPPAGPARPRPTAPPHRSPQHPRPPHAPPPALCCAQGSTAAARAPPVV